MAGHLEAWYQTPLGRTVLQAEQQQLALALARVFGFHLVQLGSPQEMPQLITSSISHQICVHAGEGLAGDLQADFVALPFAEKSIDAVVMPHVLEFCAHPQAILAEAGRILLPEGRLFILGFNPFSLFGLKHLCQHKGLHLPWQGQFLSAKRISKWLNDLSFEITDINFFYYHLPINHKSSFTHSAVLEKCGSKLWASCGSIFLLSAKKKIAELIPLRSKKNQLKTVKLRTGVIEPTARGQQ